MPFCESRLPAQFVTNFDRLRKMRNSVMHAVDPRRSLEVSDVAKAVLQAADTLIGQHAWPEVRHRFYWEQANIHSVQGADVDYLNGEYALVVNSILDDILEPADSIMYYGFDPKQRRYLCLDCSPKYYQITLTLEVFVSEERTC